MSRAIKPAATIAAEGKSHRTKAELEARSKAEQALLSGEKLKERGSVRADELAHSEFRRVSRLLAAIGKADSLYTAIVNRYCELYSETRLLAQSLQTAAKLIGRLNEAVGLLDREGESDPDKLLAASAALAKALSALNSADSKLMSKRKMMLDIEKECCMTVSAALRTIPKEPDKPDNDALIRALNGEDL